MIESTATRFSIAARIRAGWFASRRNHACGGEAHGELILNAFVQCIFLNIVWTLENRKWSRMNSHLEVQPLPFKYFHRISRALPFHSIIRKQILNVDWSPLFLFYHWILTFIPIIINCYKHVLAKRQPTFELFKIRLDGSLRLDVKPTETDVILLQ